MKITIKEPNHLLATDIVTKLLIRYNMKETDLAKTIIYVPRKTFLYIWYLSSSRFYSIIPFKLLDKQITNDTLNFMGASIKSTGIL